MKNHDEIKKGLECCSIDDYHCGKDCPYKDNCITENRYKALEADALALIQRLEAQNAELSGKIAQLQAERDAAVADIKRMVQEPYEPAYCDYCKKTEEECGESNCRHRSEFEWRGMPTKE